MNTKMRLLVVLQGIVFFTTSINAMNLMELEMTAHLKEIQPKIYKNMSSAEINCLSDEERTQKTAQFLKDHSHFGIREIGPEFDRLGRVVNINYIPHLQAAIDSKKPELVELYATTISGQLTIAPALLFLCDECEFRFYTQYINNKPSPVVQETITKHIELNDKSAQLPARDLNQKLFLRLLELVDSKKYYIKTISQTSWIRTVLKSYTAPELRAIEAVYPFLTR